MRSVFVGIDVAIAKRKRLPVCVCTVEDGRLRPLNLKSGFDKPPSGMGNKLALQESKRNEFALEVVDWLTRLESKCDLKIERIAIDAPQNYSTGGRRSCEQALDKCQISCFATPDLANFTRKIQAAEAHIQNEGSVTTMPNANQIWMLVGFSLFRALEKKYECLEVFPQAIVRTMGCKDKHKSTSDGFNEQVKVFASHMLQPEAEIEKALNTLGFGSKHDRLDAWLSAWVASLPEVKRSAYGTPPHDAIWVPKL